MEDGSRIVSHESWKFARTIDKIELPEFKYQHEEYGVCPGTPIYKI